MRKYKNVWLNNQYIAESSKKIECPFCMFWMRQSLLKKGINKSIGTGTIHVCNNKKCDFFIQILSYQGQQLMANVGFQPKKNNQLWLNYFFNGHETSLMNGHITNNNGQVIYNNIQIRFDLTKLDKFVQDLELFNFFS